MNFCEFARKSDYPLIMEVNDMRHREFIQPTPEEIERRRAMYAQAEELGIDLLSFDEQKQEASHRRDVWDAVFCLGTGQTLPAELRERLLQYKKVS